MSTRTLPARKDPLWHALALFSGVLFSLMLFIARIYPELLMQIDGVVAPHLVPLQTVGVIDLFLAITILGSVTGTYLIAFGSFFFIQSYVARLRVALSLLVTSGSFMFAKAFVERARPEPLQWITKMSTYSFPSGHASLATALYGSLAVIGYRHARTAFGRACVIGLALFLIFVVSVSRLILNVHYFTDVVAGMLLGAFWTSVVFILPHKPLTRTRK